MRVPQHIVGIRDGGGAVELEKLDELSRIAVRMPSAVADYLRSTYPKLNLQGVPMERQALQLLVSQQARYAVVDEAQLSRLSGEAEFAGLAVVGDIGLPQLLRVATRREWPELAGIMQSALRAIPARDLDQLHNRWLQAKYPRLAESPGLWQNLSLLLTLLREDGGAQVRAEEGLLIGGCGEGRAFLPVGKKMSVISEFWGLRRAARLTLRIFGSLRPEG